MTAVATEKDVFLDHFSRFDNRWENAPFARLRQAARRRFRELPLPGPKTEDWRFTNLAGLRKIAFEPAAEVAPVARPELPLPCQDGALRLVFVNGQFRADFSTLIGPPRGVQVGNLTDFARSQVESFLGKYVDFGDQPFTALNTGLFHDGAFVSIGDGEQLERPIEILHFTESALGPVAVHPRTLIVLGKNSQATVLERFQGTGVYFANAVTEIVLGEHARMDHYKLQDESLDAFHLANTQIVLAGRGNFSSHFLSWGGSLVRNEVRVRFDAENSEATVNGLYVASGRQHIDNFTVIDHAMPRCASHELYKGILSDHAQGVFNGKIFVRQDAQKTDAKQTNKVLLRSENAVIHTKPQLEIFADDVKCTHGATVGQLDEEQIFYLRTRGLEEKAARDLLTYAFVNDVVERVKLDAIKEQLQQRILMS